MAGAAVAYAETIGLPVDPTSSTAHVGEQAIRLVTGRPLEEPAVVASAVEFLLEGLHLSKRLNKDEVGGKAAYRGRGG